jgi:hypothetical protein
MTADEGQGIGEGGEWSSMKATVWLGSRALVIPVAPSCLTKSPPFPADSLPTLTDEGLDNFRDRIRAPVRFRHLRLPVDW